MASQRPAGFAALPRQAQILICATVAAGLPMLAAGTLAGPVAAVDWPLVAVAVLLCAGANLFEVFAPGHYSLQPNFAFFIDVPPSRMWSVPTRQVGHIVVQALPRAIVETRCAPGARISGLRMPSWVVPRLDHAASTSSEIECVPRSSTAPTVMT